MPTTTTTPFPFLHLPYVVTGKVLKFMAPDEQLQLSFVSKKTKNVVKKFARRFQTLFDLRMTCHDKSLMMEFYHSNNRGKKVIIKFETTKRSKYSKRRQWQFDDVDVPVDCKRMNNVRLVKTYWKNKIEGFKHLLSHFLDVFNPNVSLDICHQNEHIVFEILSNLQNSRLDLIRFLSKDSSDDLYQKILDLSCKVLDLFTKPSTNFRYRNSMVPMKFSELFVAEALWVHLDNFLYCKEVILCNAIVKPNEFNQFLKKWLQSDSQLEYLKVNMDYFTFSMIRDGIPVTPLKQASTGKFFLNFKDGHCFALEQNNGEKAVILYEEQYDSVVLKTDSYRLS